MVSMILALMVIRHRLGEMISLSTVCCRTSMKLRCVMRTLLLYDVIFILYTIFSSFLFRNFYDLCSSDTRKHMLNFFLGWWWLLVRLFEHSFKCLIVDL